MKRLLLAWAVTAIAATGAAVAVLGLLGGGLTGTSGRVMTQEEARATLARVTTATQRPPLSPSTSPSTSPSEKPSASPPVSPSVSASPGVTQTPENEVIRSAGGTVIASCAGGQVTLRSWSPAQGYSVDGVDPGPDTEAGVEFEADAEGAEDVEIKVRCEAGRPVMSRD
ncbi:hypothetical protein ACQEUU_12650 [Nonomuraea sp. CA-218870]|uniref:hypothetical protein n=1 Tax=Nonomuraea sp. CA-218870 TaxID=3239998 RepID=UPI003D8C0C83